MKGPAPVLLWTLPVSAILLITPSCATPPSPNAPTEVAATDSATVILSKYYASRNYRNWLGRLNDSLGGRPIRFVQAYGMDALTLESELARAEAIVLTGGEDIHPGRYGQPDDTVRCGRIDEERDRVEHLLLDVVKTTGTPCLGVCRGLQVMNVHGGGTLRPHLPDDGFEGHRGGAPGDTRDTLHAVLVRAPWSYGSGHWLAGETASVVSHHHQGIGMLAPGFIAWVEAPDGLIEGIRWSDTASVSYLVGVQYHPERSLGGSPLTDGLGVGLLEAAAARR